MNNQKRIDKLNTRVTEWSENFKASGRSNDEMVSDPEFKNLINELMAEDTDTILVLLGKTLQENNSMPDWLNDFTDVDELYLDPSKNNSSKP